MKYFLKVDNSENLIPINGFFLQAGSHQPIPKGRYITVHLPVSTYFTENYFNFFEQLVIEGATHTVEIIAAISEEDMSLLPTDLVIKTDSVIGDYTILIHEKDMEVFNTQISSSTPWIAPSNTEIVYQIQFFKSLK